MKDKSTDELEKMYVGIFVKYPTGGLSSNKEYAVEFCNYMFESKFILDTFREDIINGYSIIGDNTYMEYYRARLIQEIRNHRIDNLIVI